MSNWFARIPSGKMKVLLLTLLLLLLCSTQVLTLQCFTCVDENDDICKTVTECPPEAQYCKTTQRGTLLVPAYLSYVMHTGYCIHVWYSCNCAFWFSVLIVCFPCLSTLSFLTKF
ncbi:hypothetical protein INR49_015876 [Caranx melampygus]|nr:hypothetical protein INR49_015876 [Caranx melampygus]